MFQFDAGTSQKQKQELKINRKEKYCEEDPHKNENILEQEKQL
jgi:hypothetical protein